MRRTHTNLTPPNPNHLKFNFEFNFKKRQKVPALNIFETSFRRGKFDDSRKLANGALMDFAHIYPMDAVFDTPEDVPEEVRNV